MKKSAKFWGIVAAVGLAMMVLGNVLDGRAPDVVNGSLIGIGVGVLSVGVSQWKIYHMEKTNPAKFKQHMIESQDERNRAIRYKAQAVAGEVLQWLIIAVAWVAIFLDAPTWVPLAFIGIFLFKSALEVYLMSRYQKTM